MNAKPDSPVSKGMHRKLKTKSLAEMSIPEHKKRRGAYVIKMAIRKLVSRQSPQALRTAARMAILMPVLQMIVMVGIFNAELWVLLLGAEGLLIGFLASSQLSNPEPESRLVGFGVAVLNTLALSVVGAFLGSQVFWITGLLSILPVIFLVIRRTRGTSVKRAKLSFGAMWLLVMVLASGSRIAMEISKTDIENSTRAQALDVAFGAMQIRGDNGTERALLRLRQAQAAFEAGEYAAAFQYASDGLQDDKGNGRPIPKSDLADGLLKSLFRMKAQAFYNHTWKKTDPAIMPVKYGPLEDEIKDAEHVRIRWGW
ncbi:MAG: hypothetical protein V3V10_04215 [Planctomycetota bacterium]